MCDSLRRRTYLATVSATAVGLAGCPGDGGADDADTPASDSTEDPGTQTTDADSSSDESTPSVDLSVTLGSETITAGDPITVTVSIGNSGGSGSLDLSLTFEGEEVASRTVSVPAGQTTVDITTSDTHRLGPVPVGLNEAWVGSLTVERPSKLHVSTDGDDENPGTAEAPLRSIQTGIDQAEPGDTLQVEPGEYQGPLQTQRPGTEEEPITITGPREAVLKPDPEDWRKPLSILHSHVHLRGLTLDGLLDPSAPEEPSSYASTPLVTASPPNGNGEFERREEYLTDVVIKPEAVGNAQGPLIMVMRSRGVEIGEFEVVGPAGAGWVFSDEPAHAGEIIYLGQPPFNVLPVPEWYPWNEYDMTNDVHIHHIDNSAGHPHSELVDCKMGTHDVTIEYCTVAGGSQNNEPWDPACVGLRGHDITVRWCRLEDGAGHGLTVNDRRAYDLDQDLESTGPSRAYERAGSGNSVYGNVIRGFEGEAMNFPDWIEGQPLEQGHVCGNEIDGETDFDPAATCSDAVPESDAIGHLGGDSPWS